MEIPIYVSFSEQLQAEVASNVKVSLGVEHVVITFTIIRKILI